MVFHYTCRTLTDFSGAECPARPEFDATTQTSKSLMSTATCSLLSLQSSLSLFIAQRFQMSKICQIVVCICMTSHFHKFSHKNLGGFFGIWKLSWCVFTSFSKQVSADLHHFRFRWFHALHIQNFYKKICEIDSSHLYIQQFDKFFDIWNLCAM